MIVTIHQPEHLPWLGLLDKASQADLWVLLDNVQYRRHYFQNRNRIRSSNGATYLTVPVHATWGNDLIKDVTVDNHSNWQTKCWKTLQQSYARAPHFREYAGYFADLYSKHWESLVDLNGDIIRFLLGAFRIEVETRLASTIECSGAASDLLLSICQNVGATVYLSGISGRDYLELDDWARAGIEVRFQEFYHPVYRQCFEPFMPCMSSVDLLFNHGPDAHQVLLDRSTPRLGHVFL
ncbi:MAG: WbqC family protein [Chloroflexi bacterium]|nr:WbqC family protein [Chloroflexota bacterium]